MAFFGVSSSSSSLQLVPFLVLLLVCGSWMSSSSGVQTAEAASVRGGGKKAAEEAAAVELVDAVETKIAEAVPEMMKKTAEDIKEQLKKVNSLSDDQISKSEKSALNMIQNVLTSLESSSFLGSLKSPKEIGISIEEVGKRNCTHTITEHLLKENMHNIQRLLPVNLLGKATEMFKSGGISRSDDDDEDEEEDVEAAVEEAKEEAEAEVEAVLDAGVQTAGGLEGMGLKGAARQAMKQVDEAIPVEPSADEVVEAVEEYKNFKDSAPHIASLLKVVEGESPNDYIHFISKLRKLMKDATADPKNKAALIQHQEWMSECINMGHPAFLVKYAGTIKDGNL